MLTVQGIYQKGQLILEQPVDTRKDYKVLVTFVDEVGSEPTAGRRVFGTLKDVLKTPNDFNEPIEDLKEYM